MGVEDIRRQWIVIAVTAVEVAVESPGALTIVVCIGTLDLLFFLYKCASN